MSQKTVLAYDLGGTKVAVGVVNEKGRILAQTRALVAVQKGQNFVIEQLADLGKDFLRKFRGIESIGMASAGPLDPYKGVLLDPTNLVTKGKGWGKVPIASLLEKKLGLRVHLENDAAAAILAEYWVGAARKIPNSVILTLGTGLGIGTLCNGFLERSGRKLHPEASHITINAGDREAPCGCGNYGCMEAYLSGWNFERRMQKHWGRPSLTGEQIAAMARKGDRKARAAFNEYAELMAYGLQNLVVLYAPEVIVFTGSFAATTGLFLPKTKKILAGLLKRRRVGVDLMPELALSKLHNNAGIIGGAFVALFRPESAD